MTAGLQVFGLGFVSTFDQVLDGLPVDEQTNVFDAYVRALDEDPNKYRGDAQRLEAWAKGLGSPEGLMPNESGDDTQRELAGIAAAGKEEKFFYSKFFAIGLFRCVLSAGDVIARVVPLISPCPFRKLVNRLLEVHRLVCFL